jgi:hypothetical protein
MSPLRRNLLAPRLLTALAAAAALTLVPVAPAFSLAAPPRITAVTVKTVGNTLQLAVTATGPLTYRTMRLATPPRLVVDMPGAVVDNAVPPLINVNRGGLTRVRVAQFQVRPPIARVVVDMDSSVPYTISTVTPSTLVARFTGPGSPAPVLTAPKAAAASRAAAVPRAAATPRVAAAPRATPRPPAAGVAAKPLATGTAGSAQASPPPAGGVVAGPPPAAPAVAGTPSPAPAVVAQARPTPGAPQAQATPPGPARISLEFRNAELADVLTALAKVCNYNIVTDATVKGLVTVRLVDVTCEEALRFILQANNLGYRTIGRNLIIMAAEKLAPPPEAPTSVTYSVGFAVAKDVAEAVTKSVPGIRVAPDARTNAIVVVATAAQHEEVRKILTSLDIQLTQVMIETRVVDISMAELRSAGLDWGLTAVPVIQVQGVFPNQIAVGIATAEVLSRLSAMVTDRKARVISAPRVAVIDGNPATVNLGEEVPIPAVDPAGRRTYTFKPVGVILEILPKVNREGLITTKVKPTVSAVIEFLQTVDGPIPRLSSRTAESTMTIRAGESIVLAGLISAAERRTVIRVPLLGDIPVIGSLFRTTTTDRQETEVIFVVTPVILPAQGAPAAPSPTPTPPP